MYDLKLNNILPYTFPEDCIDCDVPSRKEKKKSSKWKCLFPYSATNSEDYHQFLAKLILYILFLCLPVRLSTFSYVFHLFAFILFLAHFSSWILLLIKLLELFRDINPLSDVLQIFPSSLPFDSGVCLLPYRNIKCLCNTICQPFPLWFCIGF